MTESKQPRKQRKRMKDAPLHQRHDKLHSTLAEELRQEHGTRRARVAVGDTVEVMRGDFAGETGEVIEVDLESGRVSVEDLTIEKVDGEEVPEPIDASNLRITELDLSDPVRRERLEGEE